MRNHWYKLVLTPRSNPVISRVQKRKCCWLNQHLIFGRDSNFYVLNWGIIFPHQATRAMHLSLLIASIFTLLSPVYSLYFYLEGSQTRCFLEDLPKDTLVVGQSSLFEINHRPIQSRRMELWNKPIHRKPQLGHQNHRWCTCPRLDECNERKLLTMTTG